jgi:hypothetical protein
LPNIATMIVICISTVVVIWFFQKSEAKKTATPTELLVDSNPVNQLHLSLSEKSNDETKTLIVEIDGKACELQYDPGFVENGWVESEYWWLPTSSCDADISGIQLVQLKPVQWLDLQDKKGENRVKVISDNWSALLYVNPEAKVSWEFQSTELLSPIQSHELEIAKASDTRQIGGQVYYLSGGCSNFQSICSLWGTNEQSQKPVIMLENFVTIDPSLQKLGANDQLRFAVEQNNQAIAFVIANGKKKEYVFFEYNIDAKSIQNYKILQPNTPEYSTYVR